ALGAGVAIGAKQRKSATEVEMTSLVGEVVDCDCLLVDDMTTTAGTLCEAALLLKKKGANNIYAATSHALLTEQGVQRLKVSKIKELITTDSVPQIHTDADRVRVVSVAELIGEGIRRIHDNKSVSTLFELK
ncbi:MAG: ribose-phosphate diphosphokinase, partial [Kiritimatiellae bacterium]|nr:ribose-phosphate diphosphokinase [Kiritimatiellia bacterium]